MIRRRSFAELWQNLGFRRKEIPYEQPKRRAGKTSNNFYRLYDAAMLSITSYTKVGLRLATIFGSICSAVSLVIAFIYLILETDILGPFCSRNGSDLSSECCF